MLKLIMPLCIIALPVAGAEASPCATAIHCAAAPAPAIGGGLPVVLAVIGVLAVARFLHVRRRSSTAT